jgi:hypothetical protein
MEALKEYLEKTAGLDPSNYFGETDKLKTIQRAMQRAYAKKHGMWNGMLKRKGESSAYMADKTTPNINLGPSDRAKMLSFYSKYYGVSPEQAMKLGEEQILEKTAKTRPGEAFHTGVGALTGGLVGSMTGPSVMNTIKPGLMSGNKAKALVALLGAGAGGLGMNRLSVAQAKAAAKDKKAGLDKPRIISAKDKFRSQVLTGELGAIGGGFAGAKLGELGAEAIRPNILPHNLNRATLLSALAGAGLGAYGGAKLSGMGADQHNESLKKK